jgi:hypothetical protein
MMGGGVGGVGTGAAAGATAGGWRRRQVAGAVACTSSNPASMARQATVIEGPRDGWETVDGWRAC